MCFRFNLLNNGNKVALAVATEVVVVVVVVVVVAHIYPSVTGQRHYVRR